MERTADSDRDEEKRTHGRQRRQQYVSYTLQRLRPRYLQRKAQVNFLKNPNAPWNKFSTPTIRRSVSYQVSSNFLNDEEQTKVQLASLGQQMENFGPEQQ